MLHMFVLQLCVAIGTIITYWFTEKAALAGWVGGTIYWWGIAFGVVR